MQEKGSLVADFKPTTDFDMTSDAALETGEQVQDTVSALSPDTAPAEQFKMAKTAILPATVLVAACGGGGSDEGGSNGSPAPVAVLKASTDPEAASFALRAGISVSDTDITALKSDGYSKWLNQKMDAPVRQTGMAWLSSRGYDQITADNFFDNEYPADYMMWNQLMAPDANGVRKRVALALSEYFVISTSALNLHWRGQAVAHFWDMLNKNAFGNFRTLLEDVTLNASMGYYLSTRGNRKEDESINRVPDENYAREIMQLFTIGLFELNNDGTNKLDAANKPIETYNNIDVSNLARVFTGYDWDFSQNTPKPAVDNPDYLINSIEFVTLPMTQDPTKWEYPEQQSQHSPLEVKFLDTTIPANTPAADALKTALDALFNHPNVGPFFSKQMIQRLVTSNPSSAYVGRVASVFNNNGSGMRGDLRAVFKAIFMDTEAIGTASQTSASFGKVREPMLRLVQWAQTFGAQSTSGNWSVGSLVNQAWGIGQSPFRSPSVFNFFRPGYVPANTAIAENELVAPEFQIVNEITTAAYINFMDYIMDVDEGIYGEIRAQYTKEIDIAHDAGALLERINLYLTGGQLTDATKTTIRTALDAYSVTTTSSREDKLQRIYAAVLLVMASPDYLVQK